MKKLIVLFLTILLAFTSLVACNDNQDKISIYAPDGAPALALATVMKKGFTNAEINIVASDKISSVVTGSEKKADICILPINMASKLIGSGDDYKMLGTITHGNFYFLSSADISVTRDNLSVLVGKTIGVMQIQNVPGLTLKCSLEAQNVEYATIQDTSEKVANKVNLLGINKVETARDDIDLFLIPSPQADAKELSTSLKVVGSLSEIYGENGFPQAIIVVKNSVLDKNLAFVKDFVNELKNAKNYLKEENKAEILTLINSKIESGLTPVFNENNLTNTSIERSKIQFISAKNAKETADNFIQKLKNLQPDSVKEFSENFYYLGDL